MARMDARMDGIEGPDMIAAMFTTMQACWICALRGVFSPYTSRA